MHCPKILLGESSFSEPARRVLTACGEVLDFHSYENFCRRLPEADAIVVGLEVALRKPLLDRASRLRVIASRTSELLHIDVEEARRRGIEILRNEPDAPALQQTTSTAEATMALLLALARKAPWAFDSLKRGRWERSSFMGPELQHKTIGLIGFGRLGRKVASYAQAFGMRAIAHDPNVPAELMADQGVESVSLEELLRRSDVVSVHCSYSPDDAPLLRDEHFRLMKPSALFINSARGEITNERALLDALVEGRIAGAAIDTLAGEEPDGSHLQDNPLVAYARVHDNLLILPHLGGATVEATERTQLYISERLADYLRHSGSA